MKERLLVCLLLAVSAVCAVLVVLLFKQSNPSLQRGRRNVFDCVTDTESCHDLCCSHICLTETCVQAAATLLRNMDTSVSPCEDFYQYACGRWSKHHELPSDRSYYNTFEVLKDQLKAQLKDLLEEPITEDDCNATINAKNLYASCMNEEAIEELKEQPLLILLEDLGGWPVTTANWTEDDFDWVYQIAKLQLYSNNILISQWVGPDGRNSSMHIIQLDQADLGLPSREYYVQGTQQLEAYGRYMTDIAQLLGATSEQAEADMRDVLEFETEIANFTIPREERRNYTAMYNRLTLYELQERIPLVNWTLFFNVAMPLDLPEDEEIVIYAISYLENMTEFLVNTPKRVVANYILWRFVYKFVSNLDKRFLAKQQEYYSALYGTQSIPPRWKTCTIYTNKIMGMAVGSIFVRKHFNERSKETAEEMIENIKTAFLDILENVDWMDSETRSEARQKAELMTEKIGFPDYILDPVELDKDYEGIEIKPDRYFDNVLLTLKQYTIREQMKLRTLVDRTQWVSSPAVVNAFYTRPKNFITIPAGILQPPLYHQNYIRFSTATVGKVAMAHYGCFLKCMAVPVSTPDIRFSTATVGKVAMAHYGCFLKCMAVPVSTPDIRSLSYGGIGVVIGHEITHGFDDKGRQFDHRGNLKQWWDTEALIKFQSKADCMIQQYGQYVMTDINVKVNGINTQGENIADNGGVKQSFKAYKNWVSHNPEEPLLPGLNLTHDQLFFLNYAQIWCGTMRPEAAINMIRTGVHSPGRFRVIGALSNLKDFSEAYDCPLGSPMNPDKKCHVW